MPSKPADNRKNAQIPADELQVYVLCLACDAKQFARVRPLHCARCGSVRLLATDAKPPWLQTRCDSHSLDRIGNDDEDGGANKKGRHAT